MNYQPPADDEERIYIIGPLGNNPVRVAYTGIPPCLWCGKPVECPSMDGPLVCGPCDRGRDDEGLEWGWMTRKERERHFRDRMAEIRALDPPGPPAKTDGEDR